MGSRAARRVASWLLVLAADALVVPGLPMLPRHSGARRPAHPAAAQPGLLPTGVLHATPVRRRSGGAVEMNKLVGAVPVFGMLWAVWRYVGQGRPLLLVPFFLLQDVACVGVDVGCGLAKFGWRAAIFAFVASTLLKMGVKVFMAGGPLKALRRAGFGFVATVARSVNARAGASAPWAAKLEASATERMPAKAMENPFGEGAANPFGGGANPFGGGASPFGGGASPFGGGGGGGGANPFGEMMSAMEGMEGMDGGLADAPREPFRPSSATPGVTVKVRPPGGAKGAAGGTRAAGPDPDAVRAYPKTPPGKAAAPADAEQGVIDVGVEGGEDGPSPA